MTVAIRAAVATCFLALIPGLAPGQGMCVPDPVKAAKIEGIVLFEAGGKARPLPDVTVSISRYGYRTPSVASSVSNQDGHFSISDAAPGRYWLSLRHNTLIGFSTELRLGNTRNPSTKFLIATIRNDPNKPCGGGDVKLSPVMSEDCRSIQYEDQNQVDYGPLKVRRIEGSVMDMKSTPVPGACVGVFSEPDHRLLTVAETGENGLFAPMTLTPGKYRLVAKYDHFGTANVIVEVGAWPSGGFFQEKSLVIHLRPRGIDTTSFVDWKQ